jgi:hypothetical protein
MVENMVAGKLHTKIGIIKMSFVGKDGTYLGCKVWWAWCR